MFTEDDEKVDRDAIVRRKEQSSNSIAPGALTSTDGISKKKPPKHIKKKLYPDNYNSLYKSV
jgi:hypothetical protein